MASTVPDLVRYSIGSAGRALLSPCARAPRALLQGGWGSLQEPARARQLLTIRRVLVFYC